jgi:hypothetical protein
LRKIIHFSDYSEIWNQFNLLLTVHEPATKKEKKKMLRDNNVTQILLAIRKFMTSKKKICSVSVAILVIIQIKTKKIGGFIEITERKVIERKEV